MIWICKTFECIELWVIVQPERTVIQQEDRVSQTIRAPLTHAGIRVRNLPAMRAFYEQALGLIVTDAGRRPVSGQEFVFMTAEADKHHQFVLVSGRVDSSQVSTVFQLSFRLTSLAQLRLAQAQAREAGATRFVPISHGNAWSVYYDDPEGNTVEIYVDSPWYVPQPFGDPLDLSQSDDEILRQTETRCRQVQGFMPAEHWQAQVSARLI